MNIFNMNSKKYSKFTFTLKNIDANKIDNLYNIELVSNLSMNNNNMNNITSIDDLRDNDERNYYSFLDESKRKHNCLFSMSNHLGNNLQDLKNISCYWCHHNFTTMPIGCPIKYNSKQIIKKYKSEITSEEYKLHGNISDKKYEFMNNNSNGTLSFSNNEHYITDGVFCSFNCCLAYINDNSENIKYDMSKMLLARIYSTIFNIDFNINPAPNWRILQKYGGVININDFRNNFNKIEYIPIGNTIQNKLFCKTMGELYEQRVKF
jgi:hypothetical protein